MHGIDFAIEVGGGDGQYLLGFGSKFSHVIFVDGSLVNVVLAKALSRDDGLLNVTFVRADVTSLPIPTDRASMVHCNGVIEHVCQPGDLVRECTRVAQHNGYTVVISPNRIPITVEPHFRLPLYGLIPAFFRQRLIVISRGKQSEEGTDLLTVWQLRRQLKTEGTHWDIFVIPRGIRTTARSTLLRRSIAFALRSPVGALADWLVNRFLLPFAHTHIAIGSTQGAHRGVVRGN